MAAALGCFAPDLIAGVGLVSGGYVAPCRNFPRAPAISIIFVDDSCGTAKSRRSRDGKVSPARKGILGSPHIMKKFAAIAVAASMFALAACGEKAAEEATTDAPAAEAVAEEGADAAAAGADAAAAGADAAAAGADAAAAPAADAAAAPAADAKAAPAADAAAAPAEEKK